MAATLKHVDLSRAAWRKSTRSSQDGNCVEVVRLSGVIAVRDSKNPEGPKLIFSTETWRGFTQQAKADG